MLEISSSPEKTVMEKESFIDKNTMLLVCQNNYIWQPRKLLSFPHNLNKSRTKEYNKWIEVSELVA